jgi:hypothetical protein
MNERNRDHALRPASANPQPERERIYVPAEHERHYAPLNRRIHPADASQFAWKAENGTVQSYRHVHTHRHIHIDGATGQFYDQQKTAISQQAALDRAIAPGKHHSTAQMHGAALGNCRPGSDRPP